MCSMCRWYWSMIPGQWCLFLSATMFWFYFCGAKASIFFIDSKHGNIELKKMKIKYLVSVISVLNKSTNNNVIKRVEMNGIGGQTME